MRYEYHMVQIPRAIVVKEKEYQGKEAAYYLQDIANKFAEENWEFWRVDTIGVFIKPGCLAGLFGRAIEEQRYYVVTFRRPKA
jgi:hypothetical protein